MSSEEFAAKKDGWSFGKLRMSDGCFEAYRGRKHVPPRVRRAGKHPIALSCGFRPPKSAKKTQHCWEFAFRADGKWKNDHQLLPNESNTNMVTIIELGKLVQQRRKVLGMS